MAKRSRDAESSNIAAALTAEDDQFPLVGHRTVEPCTTWLCVDLGKNKPPKKRNVSSRRRTPLPDWLVKLGWASAEYPLDDSIEAITQWFNLVEIVLCRVLEWEHETREDYREDVADWREDAVRLIDHVAAKYGLADSPEIAETAGVDRLLRFIRKARAWVQGSKRKIPAERKATGQRGRKPDTDKAADKRVYETWKTGCYKRYEDLARALGESELDVRHAVDRHRKRIPSKSRRK
jgi:hypothetical protein